MRRLHRMARAFMLAVGLFALATVEARNLRPRDIDALPSSAPTATSAYGPAPQQTGELRLPEGKGPFPVAVVIHGGCWTAGFATLRNTAAIATALTKRGIATWNIEYRQVGEPGGGWPGSFRDWAAGVDHLRVLGATYPLDLSRVVVAGHSAGAHAALWVAARHRLPADSEVRGANPLPVRAAIAIDGPGDIADFIGFDADVCGKPVIVPLMGATPDAEPERYRQANPRSLLPLGAPQALVTARVLLPAAARAYRLAGGPKGDSVDLIYLDTGHFEPIAPGDPAWTQVEAAIVAQVEAHSSVTPSR